MRRTNNDGLRPVFYITVLQGLHYSDLMETGQAKSLTELSERLGVERTFLYHSLELVNLAPDIISAVLKGAIPPELKLKNLRGNIPTNWEVQRMLYGFTKP